MTSYRAAAAVLPLVLCLPLAGGATGVSGDPAPGDGANDGGGPTAPFERTFVLEEIELRGNERTPASLTERTLALKVGESVDPARILEAVEMLRESELFEAVSFKTERGSERGRIRLVLDVTEKGIEFRFGTGYRDLDGWYVVPAQLRLDNRLGRGERVRLSLKLGYRIAGLEATLDEDRIGRDGRAFWGTSAGSFAMQRRYFLDGVEYEHPVSRSHLGAYLGRRIGRAWRLEVGARFEAVDADSVPRAAVNDELRGVEKGDEPDFATLPEAVAGSVGRRQGQIYHAQLSLDRRARARIASTPVRGIWGRMRVEGIVREDAEALGVTVDLRAYRAVFGGAMALRARTGVLGRQTAFYDRFHLGGLYTIRGYPSQSLSSAEGDTRFWSSSVEFRGPVLGRPDHPSVMAVLFADAGQGWTEGELRAEDVRASVGFGFRVRVPWLDSLGFDFAAPLDPTPVRESFHLHGALGWNF